MFIRYFPVFAWSFAVADNFIKFMTDKWLECVPFLRVFCNFNMFTIIQSGNITADPRYWQKRCCGEAGYFEEIIYFVVLIVFIMA